MTQFLKRILFAAIVSLCASFAAIAQNDQDRRVPPKGTPPVVVVPPKRGDDNKPKDDKKGDDKKPKKPESAYLNEMRSENFIYD